MRKIRVVAALLALAACGVLAPSAGAVVGGPVILGGDDLTDHGGLEGETGAAEEGWIYIEAAVANIKAKVGRANDGSIAVVGSADPGPLVPGMCCDAGAAIKNAAEQNGMTVRYFDTVAEINAGFAAIANGSYNPAILHISGTGAGNDIDECNDGDPANEQTDGEAITANAQVINTFVNQGGGLLSHSDCYDWVTALIPGLIAVSDEGAGGAPVALTAAGQAAFPGITNEMMSAGPWHNHFQGDLGGLEVLATSEGDIFQVAQAGEFQAQQAQPQFQVIIGGGQVSFTQRPTDLSITKTDSADPARAGRNLTYTLSVTNNGPTAATGVTVTDNLPSGLSARSASASQGSCSGTTTVTCAIGNLAVGASATVTIVVRPSAAGTITNTASVSGDQPDPNSANNSASQSTVVTAAAAAQVDRSAPVVAVGGVRASGCLRSAFTARVNIRDRSRMRRVVVTVDGRQVQSTRSKRFTVSVPAAGLRAGRHTLRVVAIDARGNRRVVSRTFRRCAPPVIAPVFTG